MLKYFLMAINEGDCSAMHSLGYYYQGKNDYDNMLKYYLMALNKGYFDTMFNLACYYKKQKDYDNMLKYYSMAVDKGDSDAMINLGVYYFKQKDYVNMLKYYLMAIQNGNETGKQNLNKKIKENDDVVINNLIKLTIDGQKQINILKQENNKLIGEITHLKYMPGGPGYLDTKQHFDQTIKN